MPPENYYPIRGPVCPPQNPAGRESKWGIYVRLPPAIYTERQDRSVRTTLGKHPPLTCACNYAAATDSQPSTRRAKASFLTALLHFWRSGASALPCAGAAPPQRPPTKPSLTDRVHSSQPVGWRAWRRLHTSCVTRRLNGSKDDWLVNCCGLVVTCALTSTSTEPCRHQLHQLLGKSI